MTNSELLDIYIPFLEYIGWFMDFFVEINETPQLRTELLKTSRSYIDWKLRFKIFSSGFD